MRPDRPSGKVLVMLYGRATEQHRIRTLLSDARAGRSGALAVLAGPGEGKSALLRRAAELTDPSWRILRCTGIETAAELPFTALRQLLEPALPHLDVLPDPQREALSCALGLRPLANPERFLVGLATLSLLAELATDAPVLCLIDDAQWLDQSSLDALLFTARRLGTEGVVLLFAGRAPFRAPGLERLCPAPLDSEQARTLLADHFPTLPVEVRDRVLAEAAGNPLALLELPGMNPGMPQVGPLALSDRLLAGYQQHIAALPEAARRALLVAAADDAGELATVLRVLAALGAGPDALAAAERGGLVDISGQRVLFRHPVMRAAAYRSAPADARRAVHAALATALADDPDRQAWHLAEAAREPNETVAAALESAAVRARDRCGHGAAASTWERAAQLSPAPRERARRLVEALENAAGAGRFDSAERLADELAPLPADPVWRARIARVRAYTAFERGAPERAYRLLRAGAAAVAATDPERAAVLLLEAGRCAWAAADLGALREARDQLRELPPSLDRDRFLLAYDGALGLYADDPADGIALLRRNRATASELRQRDPVVRLVLSTQAIVLGDTDATRDLLTELAEDCRAQGAAGWLATVESRLAQVEFMAGRFREAELLATEAAQLGDHVDQPMRGTHAAAVLALTAAAMGDAARCLELVERYRQGPPIAAMHRTQFDWAVAVLDMARGDFESALDRMEALDRTPMNRHGQWLSVYADRIEAAVRIGRPERARKPLDALRIWAAALDAPWAQALLLRGRAVLTGDPDAYARALELHTAAGRWFDRARTGLLYGEWLRHQHRFAAARTELHTAADSFDRVGAHSWAERARAELRAAGAVATTGRESVAALTPQELQVARLAATGGTNREIAARLFLSPKTVGHHLSRVFRKLGVANRVELARLELN
ncbi:AAA family ATPase [Nocardia otitidiscaviarum]|uniref:ATP-binding protein n=1 Tax=Nocardia otitidiscaviarum TaxID=1823 RepID=UPI001893EE9D|nr:helix-turn-helix transcriptional regulator [Nocardia otitidiscaviarum]MBF6240145.1 AAA family ATPase [Nocardia otitidiscaviarum]